ncbi:MAG: hypothetical protein JO305_00410 [Alphaproteobacteria bacterium]|nr:hypothetical protein [Alphaproteobacteria bacterium]
MAELDLAAAGFPKSRPMPALSHSRTDRRPRLAIVSTYHDLCGIAAYTRCLQRQLGDVFDVTVFDLDQYLLRHTHPHVRKLADRYVKQICRAIAGFDAVNLQLEHGIFGRTTDDIFRRFVWLVRAAPALSVTFHTMQPWALFDRAAWLREIARFRFGRAGALRAGFYRSHKLSAGIPRHLRRAQRRKPVTAIVHNRRDLAEMKHVHAIRQVYDHPLVFIDEAEAEKIRAAASRRQFPLIETLPDTAVLVGVFGFLGRYKGFETVIRAMQHLPDHYHLLVFGAVHPNEIASRQPIDPYLASLLSAAYIDTTLPERLSGAGAGVPAMTVTVDRELSQMLVAHPRDLSARLHFMGAMTDSEFLAGLAVCDTAVFPYLEVGQSSSGPIAQALELGCRIIASRTRAFMEFARYHPDRIEFFDIGNHLELAKRILAAPQFDPCHYRPAYNAETNKAVYRAANGAPARFSVPQ